MAETHHKPETGMPTTRCYTVGYVSDAKYQPMPAVTLKGHWLKEMGFDTGTALEVKILPGCLILAVKPPSTEPEVMQALRQVCGKLSGRKQRQVTEFIQVIAAPQNRT